MAMAMAIVVLLGVAEVEAEAGWEVLVPVPVPGLSILPICICICISLAPSPLLCGIALLFWLLVLSYQAAFVGGRGHSRRDPVGGRGHSRRDPDPGVSVGASCIKDLCQCAVYFCVCFATVPRGSCYNKIVIVIVIIRYQSRCHWTKWQVCDQVYLRETTRTKHQPMSLLLPLCLTYLLLLYHCA